MTVFPIVILIRYSDSGCGDSHWEEKVCDTPLDIPSGATFKVLVTSGW